MQVEHDPIFSHFPYWTGTLPTGHTIDWNGARTKAKYASWYAYDHDVADFKPPMPDLSTEEYLEWVTLLKAAEESKERGIAPFTFIELGAGWGRWIVNAGIAAQQLDIDYRLVGVEAEPQHFLWMKEHAEENGLDLSKVTFLETAVSGFDGKVEFQVGGAELWYGQSISDGSHPELETATVPALSLATIMKDLPYVDLIDLDVQGSEFDVLWEAREELFQKVRRLYISTHSLQNEQKLREMLMPWGWYAEHDYSMMGSRYTPYGWISFGDGAQAWRNMNYDPGGRYR